MHEDDESKYQKHLRRRQSRTRRRVVRLVCVTFLVALILFLFSSPTRNDSSLSQEVRRDQSLRAQQVRIQQHPSDGKDALPPYPRQERDDRTIVSPTTGTSERKHHVSKISHSSQQHDMSRDDNRDESFSAPTKQQQLLQNELKQLDRDVRSNRAGGVRWASPRLLPSLPGEPFRNNPVVMGVGARGRRKKNEHDEHYFHVSRQEEEEAMAWEQTQQQARRHVYDDDSTAPPSVDYTHHDYDYPPVLDAPPKNKNGYPKLSTIGDILATWPQNELDHPPNPIQETLLHFNFSNPREREAALQFRNAELPFKLYNVPEVLTAGNKWTDAYLTQQLDRPASSSSVVPLTCTCQESPNNYFAFFARNSWHVDTMGLPPFRENDWTFSHWANHATYAHANKLRPDQPHFYYQLDVAKGERYKPSSQWTFVSKDLPSFSSPNETFFVFHPDQQKGIQCRFGERGVTVATHYDSGRNMVAMVTGAKRYILSPPRECGKLGIVTASGNTLWRHSVLDFSHIQLLETEEGRNMSERERGWLERARTSEAVDTVLKAGEVLYIPSFWFHYIVSLQKSAQCNARSGTDEVGTPEFGGRQDVQTCAS